MEVLAVEVLAVESALKLVDAGASEVAAVNIVSLVLQ